MTNDTPVHAEDVIPVRSRISWSAVVAGAAVALAIYLLLTLLGTAIGLSIHDRVADRSFNIGAVVYAILVTAGALFLGGFVASQMTTGENKIEGALYGLLVWAVMFALLLTVVSRLVASGMGALIGLANPVSNVAANPNWEAQARANGATDADIANFRNNVQTAPEQIRNAINDPANRQAAEENATRAAWYTFLGTLIAMAAGALGGYAGAGPTFRLFTVRVPATATAFDRRDTFVRT
jgi:hypothetical protein